MCNGKAKMIPKREQGLILGSRIVPLIEETGVGWASLKQPNKPVYRALGNPTRGKVTISK